MSKFTSAIDLRQFFPSSRCDFDATLKPTQRYRHWFKDLRLQKGADQLVAGMFKHGASVIAQCAQEDRDSERAYRLLSNKAVDLSELIYQFTKVDSTQIAGRELLVPLDATSVNLHIGLDTRISWADDFGVIDDNRSAGFLCMPSLILDAQSSCCYGLGDILIHKRRKMVGTPQENRQLRKLRGQLPFEQRESAMWWRVACNTAAQLSSAEKVTFLMDQGGDNYESWYEILADTGRDIISRIRFDRQATDVRTGQHGKLSQLLGNTPLEEFKVVEVKKLHHRSKSSGKLVKRRKRKAILNLKYIQVNLDLPGNLCASRPMITQPLYVVEVKEDAASVPAGEDPIHWRLLTTWDLDDVAQAWQVVNAYCKRWDIEQLFRLLKKDGLDIEASELGTPQKIEKLTVMALKAASLALHLVTVRDGKEFIDLKTCFEEQQIQALELLNRHYKGRTEKQSNPHLPGSMAWAAWVIARAGGWKGYASHYKPGPETMLRGLQKLENYTECIKTLAKT